MPTKSDNQQSTPSTVFAETKLQDLRKRFPRLVVAESEWANLIKQWRILGFYIVVDGKRINIYDTLKESLKNTDPENALKTALRGEIEKNSESVIDYEKFNVSFEYLKRFSPADIMLDLCLFITKSESICLFKYASETEINDIIFDFNSQSVFLERKDKVTKIIFLSDNDPSDPVEDECFNGEIVTKYFFKENASECEFLSFSGSDLFVKTLTAYLNQDELFSSDRYLQIKNKERLWWELDCGEGYTQEFLEFLIKNPKDCVFLNEYTDQNRERVLDLIVKIISELEKKPGTAAYFLSQIKEIEEANFIRDAYLVRIKTEESQQRLLAKLEESPETAASFLAPFKGIEDTDGVIASVKQKYFQIHTIGINRFSFNPFDAYEDDYQARAENTKEWAFTFAFSGFKKEWLDWRGFSDNNDENDENGLRTFFRLLNPFYFLSALIHTIQNLFITLDVLLFGVSFGKNGVGFFLSSTEHLTPGNTTGLLVVGKNDSLLKKTIKYTIQLLLLPLRLPVRAAMMLLEIPRNLLKWTGRALEYISFEPANLVRKGFSYLERKLGFTNPSTASRVTKLVLSGLVGLGIPIALGLTIGLFVPGSAFAALAVKGWGIAAPVVKNGLALAGAYLASKASIFASVFALAGVTGLGAANYFFCKKSAKQTAKAEVKSFVSHLKIENDNISKEQAVEMVKKIRDYYVEKQQQFEQGTAESLTWKRKDLGDALDTKKGRLKNKASYYTCMYDTLVKEARQGFNVSTAADQDLNGFKAKIKAQQQNVGLGSEANSQSDFSAQADDLPKIIEYWNKRTP